MIAVAVTRPDASAQQPGPAYSRETITAQVEAADELRSALQRALDVAEKRVTLSPRVYRFEGNLDFSDLDGVTIDGQGAEFVFTRGMVRLQSCRNVTVKNLFLDVEPLPFVQGTVVALDSQAKTVDMRLDPGYPAEAACSRKDGLRCVFFDPKGERELEIIDTTTPPPVEVSPGVVRIHSRRIFDVEERPLAAGDRVVLSVKTGVGGISLTDCANVTLEDITIYAAGRFAITENGLAEGGNTYRRCRVVRRPGSGRLMAGASDGFHSITQKRGPHLVECEIAHCFDDLVNIHGFFSLAVERADNGAWLIAVPGGRDFAVGSLLRFYRAPDAEPLGEARVVVCELRDTPTREEIEQRAGEHFKQVCGRTLRSL
ncbi:MAG: hypothetical protein HON70_31930, partial [Lentisphaerae bacterium]|nr:hypothetical protein [Lentisphaerota bacterium]